ncbi:MAG TPA: hypothetical protein VHE61_14815 [Opitutaceae bacterium]|nr:hypothetical protein [Opitutaceae bacterium]
MNTMSAHQASCLRFSGRLALSATVHRPATNQAPQIPGWYRGELAPEIGSGNP